MASFQCLSSGNRRMRRRLVAYLWIGFEAGSYSIVFFAAHSFFTAEWDVVKGAYENPTQLLSSAPFTFLMAVLIIFVFGPGRYSLDRFLEWTIWKKK